VRLRFPEENLRQLEAFLKDAQGHSMLVFKAENGSPLDHYAAAMIRDGELLLSEIRRLRELLGIAADLIVDPTTGVCQECSRVVAKPGDSHEKGCAAAGPHIEAVISRQELAIVPGADQQDEQ
jgi:hypothetical protein